MTPAESERLLRRLARGLEKREALHSGAAREGLDLHLLEIVGRLRSQVQQTLAEEVEGPPPRSAAVPIALALFSQPHLDTTFLAPRWQSTEDMLPLTLPQPDPPVVFPTDAMRAVLGLEDWELDELREEVDRRVGFALKQQRALDWLWQRFDQPHAKPDVMFHALFPAAPREGLGKIGWVRYGAQLYAVVDQRQPPPPAALFLGWVAPDDDGQLAPRGAFHGRYVDEGLRVALGRGIGASDTETVALLDQMVSLLPRQGCAAFLAHDQWRITGVAAMAGLGSDYATSGWLARPLAANDLYIRDFLEFKEGALTLKRAEAAFDAYATERSTTLLHQIHAEMLARLLHEDLTAPLRPSLDDLSLYDLSRHLRRVLRPLLEWAAAPETVAHVARVFQVDEEAAREQMRSLATAWEQRARAGWCGGPTQDTPDTVAGVLLMHLIGAHNGLRSAFRRNIGRRLPHRDVLLLFAAHHYAEVGAGRLLRDHRQGRPTTDPVARWFWPTWKHLQTESDMDPESTWSGPNPLF